MCIANANGIANRQPFGETVKTNVERRQLDLWYGPPII